jgi:hypothetical protein
VERGEAPEEGAVLAEFYFVFVDRAWAGVAAGAVAVLGDVRREWIVFVAAGALLVEGEVFFSAEAVVVIDTFFQGLRWD